jgi:archaellum component FlaG (FlaF/FlaG flagellin family)
MTGKQGQQMIHQPVCVFFDGDHLYDTVGELVSAGFDIDDPGQLAREFTVNRQRHAVDILSRHGAYEAKIVEAPAPIS